MSSLKLIALSSLLSSLLIAGCGVQPRPELNTHTAAGITGHVFGGQQPVANSTVQLYTVGTTGDGSAATPLLTQTVTSDANGDFSLSPNGVPLYSCTNASEVYLVATGGDASPGIANPNLAMMTALGPCTSLTTSTFITVNEITTVAAVSALAPYMSSITGIGSGSSDATALAAAFTLASEYVDPSSGTSPGYNVPVGTAVPTAEIDTLGDIVAACINSGGGVAGSSNTACGSLFSLTTPTNGSAPADTIMALLYLAQNPTLNTTALYNLATATPPFQPVLASAPSSFQIELMPTNANSLQISLSTLVFPATAVGFTAQALPVTLQNSGSATITIDSIGIAGVNASEFLQTNTCPTMLQIGESCTAQVTATPAADGQRNGYLSIVSSSPDSPQYVPLTVTGTAPAAGPVTVSASTLSFTLAGTVQDVTLANYGSATLNIQSIAETDTGATFGGASFAIVNNNCGLSLAAQSVCTISVVSNNSLGDQQGNPETFTGTLTITDDASTGPQSVSLTSTNLGGFSGSAGLNGEVSFAAGPVGVEQTAAAISYGPYNAYSTAPDIHVSLGGAEPGDFSYAITQNNYSTSYCLGPSFNEHNDCLFAFSFTPSAAGSRTAKAILNGGSQYILLSGSGPAAGPAFTASSGLASIDFASVYLPSSLDPNSMNQGTVSITNTGTTTFAFAGYLTGANAAEFSVNATTCASLAPGLSCTVSYTLKESAIGTYMANMVVRDGNSGLLQVVPITGKVIYWQVDATPTSLQFGYQTFGTTSAAQTAVFADPNGYPLGHVLTAVLQTNSNFVLTQGSTCSASLTQTCTFAVAFAPNQGGSITEYLTVTDQTSGDLTQVTLTGSSGAPAISFAPSPLTFATRSNGTTSVPSPITVTNTGTATLTISSVSLVGAVNSNFTETNNCSSVAPNGACTLEVTFAPTSTGMQSAMISVVSNAAGSPSSVGVSGTAD